MFRDFGTGLVAQVVAPGRLPLAKPNVVFKRERAIMTNEGKGVRKHHFSRRKPLQRRRGLVAFRLDDWKAVFVEMKHPGGFAVWQEPFTPLRIPKLFHMRMDPFERADIVSDQYNDWLVRNDFKMFQITTHAGAFLQTFVEYRPSQEQASFSIDQIAGDVEAKINENARKGAGSRALQ